MDSDIISCYRNIIFLVMNVFVLQNRGKHNIHVKIAMIIGSYVLKFNTKIALKIRNEMWIKQVSMW